ncbi:hypothetical protein DSECCO2_266240 [anaerobic digester metagenome]
MRRELYEGGYRTVSLNKVTAGLVLCGVDANDVLDYVEFDFTEKGLVRYTVKDSEVIKKILYYEDSMKNNFELMVDIVMFNKVFRLIKDKSREIKRERTIARLNYWREY